MNKLKFTRLMFVALMLILLLALSNEKANARRVPDASPAFSAIDEYINAQMHSLQIPGLALGIIQDNQVVHLKGFGTADSSGHAVIPQTPFYIGSDSKAFTALAVMQLVEAGKIELDAPVQKYLPWFTLADKTGAAKITVRNLLNQTSGISTYDGNNFWASQDGLEAVVRQLATLQLSQPVGTRYQYSQLNFVIAGLLVERVSGQSYGEYVAQHLFAPLAMHHSYTSRAFAQGDGLAQGHYYALGRVMTDDGAQPPAYLPAGFLISSVEDLSHYAIAQLDGGQYNGVRILSPQGMSELHRPAIEIGNGVSYAMGWAVRSENGIAVVEHSGDTGRFHAVITLEPTSGRGIILLANASGFQELMQLETVSQGVANLLDGKPLPPSYAAPISFSFLYWGILLLPVLQILGIIHMLRRRRNKMLRYVVMTVIFYGGLSLLVWFGIPALVGFPVLTGMRIMYPELGYSLIVSAVIGIGWTIIYLTLAIKQRVGDAASQTPQREHRPGKLSTQRAPNP